MTRQRTESFEARTAGRYWWFQSLDAHFVPPLFSFLADEEWALMRQWYDETDARNSAGEANVPMLSVLQGLIMGNRISNIVPARPL